MFSDLEEEERGDDEEKEEEEGKEDGDTLTEAPTQCFYTRRARNRRGSRAELSST